MQPTGRLQGCGGVRTQWASRELPAAGPTACSNRPALLLNTPLCCRDLEAGVRAGRVGLAQAVLQFRLLCEDAVLAASRASNTAGVQQASDLLDLGNDLLARFDPQAVDGSWAAAAAAVAAPAAPGLPPETFFLPAAQLPDLLQLRIDSSLLTRGAGGRGADAAAAASRKRKLTGVAAGGYRRRTKTLPSPWDAAFQVQLATALRLALALPGSPGPAEAEVQELSKVRLVGWQWGVEGWGWRGGSLVCVGGRFGWGGPVRGVGSWLMRRRRSCLRRGA